MKRRLPLDLPGPARVGAGGLRWASIGIATATLLLLLTNGVAVKSWLDEQPPGPFQAWAAARADWWVAQTDRVGLGSPRAALHGHWKRAEAARFANDQR